MAVDYSNPVDILARTVWGEDRAGGRAGMSAVAAVVLNRARRPGWWGSDILSVCLHRYQFSCWNPDARPGSDHQAMLAVSGQDPAFTTALIVAEQAVSGSLPDPTGGADSYYAASLARPPFWAAALVPTARIGGQIFFQTVRPGD